LKNLLNKYFVTLKILENLEKICKNPIMYLDSICLVTNSLNLLTGLLLPYNNNNKILSDIEYERIVLYAISWATGGVYENSDR
jgi:dynein heavy chain